MTGTLHEDSCNVMIISRGIIFRMKRVSDKLVEKSKTHFRLNNIFPNIVRYNVGKRFTARQATDNIIEPMATGCWMRKAKLKTKLRGLSPHANYTDRAAAAGRRS